MTVISFLFIFLKLWLLLQLFALGCVILGSMLVHYTEKCRAEAEINLLLRWRDCWTMKHPYGLPVAILVFGLIVFFVCCMGYLGACQKSVCQLVTVCSNIFSTHHPDSNVSYSLVISSSCVDGSSLLINSFEKSYTSYTATQHWGTMYISSCSGLMLFSTKTQMKRYLYVLISQQEVIFSNFFFLVWYIVFHLCPYHGCTCRDYQSREGRIRLWFS